MFESSIMYSQMYNYNDSKLSSGHLYVRQPHQIIQLVEGPPPPPRRISSVIYSTSSGGSSYPSTSDEEEEEEEEESECSSYCSSYESPQSEVRQTDDTFAVRMKRIYDWRDSFQKAMGTELSAPSSPLKRKINLCEPECDVDNVSHTSKRSRSRDEQSISSALSVHSCAACDTSFPSRQSLHYHGRTSQATDACRIAVEYDFE